jgi:hypothetical protein
VSEADQIAEHYSEYEGYKLADYRSVALPYYVIYANAVVVERRPLPPTTEYLFRAIQHGLDRSPDLSGFLGVSSRYLNRLIGKLVDERYLMQFQDESLRLGPRAEEVLSTLFEEAPGEQEISFLWDLLQKRPAGYVETLIRFSEVDRDGDVPIRAFPMRAPTVDEIPIHFVQQALALRGRNRGPQSAEVIRLREITKRLLRYQPALALIFVAEKSRDLRVKFAIDGRIDDDLSMAFAQQGGIERMGIAGEFSSKTGLFSLQKRVKDVAGAQGAKNGYGALLTRRSVLRWNIRGIEARIREEASVDLERTLAERLGELEAIELKLRQLPIRDLYPFEMMQIVKDALTRGKRRVLITTTLPSSRKLSTNVIDLICSAAKRNVRVSIYISGKPLNESAKIDNRNTALSELNKLATETKNVEVNFLDEGKRNFFEVVCDEEMLAVANDPPFGDRDREKPFRPFHGILLSKSDDVVSYVRSHIDV